MTRDTVCTIESCLLHLTSIRLVGVLLRSVPGRPVPAVI